MGDGASRWRSRTLHFDRRSGMNLTHQLQHLFHQALTGLTPDPDKYALMVRATADPKHGDYQSNCAMPLAKELGRKPQEVARELIGRLPKNDMLAKAEVAGPGFI